ncbi:MAG: helix-turn-helix domain-containing protein [Leptolyngbya sp. SIOISBB]|nr:helix-turn-helix domain-containing protein [Leptolyngbya sp. SIOISBB]
MTTPRPLTPREQNLLDRYSQCQLGMTPQAFYTKWQVSQEEIATICSRSVSTVRRWFHKGRSYRRPTIVDLRHLALMDFLLDHFEQIPENLREALCPTEQEE